MIHVDPRDPGQVATAVCGWAADRFGGPVELTSVAQSIGGGFDSYIHLLQLAGSALPSAWLEPLVVRILPSADRLAQATDEAAMQRWAIERGYPVPQVLAVLAPEELLGLPAQVMERAPGVTMLDALKATPWRGFSIAAQLAALHLRLHRLDTAGWPTARGLVDARLSLPRRAVTVLHDPALEAAVERAEALVANGLDGGEVVVCHGDFHPLNVLVDGHRASVIDWTDAGLGPREADVSRTALIFRIAAVAATSRRERVALRLAGPRLADRYLRSYRGGAALDEVGLRRWEALHALHGWAQVEMLHAGAFDAESSSAGNEARVPRALGEWLRGRFESALG